MNSPLVNLTLPLGNIVALSATALNEAALYQTPGTFLHDGTVYSYNTHPEIGLRAYKAYAQLRSLVSGLPHIEPAEHTLDNVVIKIQENVRAVLPGIVAQEMAAFADSPDIASDAALLGVYPGELAALAQHGALSHEVAYDISLHLYASARKSISRAWHTMQAKAHENTAYTSNAASENWGMYWRLAFLPKAYASFVALAFGANAIQQGDWLLPAAFAATGLIAWGVPAWKMYSSTKQYVDADPIAREQRQHILRWHRMELGARNAISTLAIDMIQHGEMTPNTDLRGSERALDHVPDRFKPFTGCSFHFMLQRLYGWLNHGEDVPKTMEDWARSGELRPIFQRNPAFGAEKGETPTQILQLWISRAVNVITRMDDPKTVARNEGFSNELIQKLVEQRLLDASIAAQYLAIVGSTDALEMEMASEQETPFEQALPERRLRADANNPKQEPARLLHR